MELTLSTPTLLFPASSLLFLAYTNRFLHLSALVRKLHSDWHENRDPVLQAQVKNLELRIQLIRWCQAAGVLSLIGCLAVLLMMMTLPVSDIPMTIFVISVAVMMISLILALWEILISGQALHIFLHEMSQPKKEND